MTSEIELIKVMKIAVQLKQIKRQLTMNRRIQRAFIFI